jgi:hypothetical protein
MRFDARHIGSGVWEIFDAGVMGWRVTDLAEHEVPTSPSYPVTTRLHFGYRKVTGIRAGID